ncbi:hypothetical protein ROJ8625_00411 [Roseivivax jejudonensis]|uniref:DUF3572 domain-containing protein n=1 Tax=Roseivivax jejudonensis TaxID=1529041 RepID=A0A1X6Y8B0_9RHOB|nr:DUF3572 domain-containing protein [Roseivivax jejudonensis]SLN13583.1 hypothetical protein ROJ8625_00411 [Roseivivax jejudonensis]
MSLSRSAAETVGLQAIAWLAADEDLLPVFMGATGADEEAFRAHLSDPSFQASVLDFVLMDDAWIRKFCDASGLDYDVPMQARAALPGGQNVHWT